MEWRIAFAVCTFFEDTYEKHTFVWFVLYEK